MADEISEWSTTAGDNTSLGAVSLLENVMTVKSVNNGFRELMAQVATGISANAFMAAYTAASASGAASIKFAEDTDNGTSVTTLQGAASLSGDITLTLPSTAGTLATEAYVDANAGGGAVQLARNGSFAVNQRGTMPTTDNEYSVDGWRLLLEAANAATIEQDTADVPTGAAYAVKLTVGSGNNNKFGIFSPIESKDVLSLRGDVVSLRVPLKATAGLTDGTGKIRIGIAEFTGTADAVSGDPISSWGAEGTNPTLDTGWAFINTPAAISVTTSWVDYLVENISVGASANNLAILIWSDDKTNTQTTDILRVGGYVTFTRGETASRAVVIPYVEELHRCMRYYQPIVATMLRGASGTSAQGPLSWGVPMMVTPTAVLIAGTNGYFEFGVADRNVSTLGLSSGSVLGGLLTAGLSATTLGNFGYLKAGVGILKAEL